MSASTSEVRYMPEPLLPYPDICHTTIELAVARCAWTKFNRGSGSDPSRQGAVEPEQVHGSALPPPVLPIG